MLRIRARRSLLLRLIALLLCLLATALAALRRLRTLSAVAAPSLLLTLSTGRALLRRLGTAIFPAACLSGALFELLHLLLHEAARLRILLGADLVVPAIRASLPALGIRFLTAAAENTFRKRHRVAVGRAGCAFRIGAHCTLRAVARNPDEERRETLRALIGLASGSSPADCWDDGRAEELLRSQSSPDELRELGAPSATIERIFAQPGAIRETAPARNIAAGTYTVRVEARFEAAHFLREYRGISEPLHGHSYKVEADLRARGGSVDGDAIAVDFVSARRKLEALAKRLDYGCINDVPPFTEINPSAENIASWFHRELSLAVADENALVRAITVWEGPLNAVTFSPDPERSGG